MLDELNITNTLLNILKFLYCIVYKNSSHEFAQTAELSSQREDRKTHNIGQKSVSFSQRSLKLICSDWLCSLY